MNKKSDVSDQSDYSYPEARSTYKSIMFEIKLPPYVDTSILGHIAALSVHFLKKSVSYFNRARGKTVLIIPDF